MTEFWESALNDCIAEFKQGAKEYLDVGLDLAGDDDKQGDPIRKLTIACADDFKDALTGDVDDKTPQDRWRDDQYGVKQLARWVGWFSALIAAERRNARARKWVPRVRQRIHAYDVRRALQMVESRHRDLSCTENRIEGRYCARAVGRWDQNWKDDKESPED